MVVYYGLTGDAAMKKTVYAVITVTALMFFPFMISAETPIPDDSDTAAYAEWLGKRIIEKPSDDDTSFFINRLLDLAPAAGERTVSDIFKAALKNMDGRKEKNWINARLMMTGIDNLDRDSRYCSDNFSILRRWNISGPWKRYGRADALVRFQPETAINIGGIERGRNTIAPAGGEIFPFRLEGVDFETVYATASVTARGAIVLWIGSDAGYTLYVNGRELYRRSFKKQQSTDIFSLRGGKGYTIQLKLQREEKSANPSFRAMISGDGDIPADIKGSGDIYSYSFTSERLGISGMETPGKTGRAAEQTENLRRLVRCLKYQAAYKHGAAALKEFSSYYPLYCEYIPLLDMMNRDDEFLAAVDDYRKKFPSSQKYKSWLADFYMTRDSAKFSELMKSNPAQYHSEISVRSYIYMLCSEKKFAEAEVWCRSLKGRGDIQLMIPEIIRASADEKKWKRSLLQYTYDPGVLSAYYYLGLSELVANLDPVMYWNKGFSLGVLPELLRDISIVYENGVIAGNEFYKGDYTDLHPEFERDAKIRKITVHIFNSDSIYIEGEDLVPSGGRINGKKYADDGLEYHSGEVITSVPYFQGVKVLSVFTARDGLPAGMDFSTNISADDRLTVRYKTSGEEFSAIRYTGKFTGSSEDIYSLATDLNLKNPSEYISSVELNVICHREFIPDLKYNGAELKSSRLPGGETLLSSETATLRNSDQKISLSIIRFGSDRDFALWYRGILCWVDRSFPVNEIFADNSQLENIVRGIHADVINGIVKRGGVNFNPDIAERVLADRRGTVEERTYLARMLFANRGIKSFIAFRKNGNGGADRILLYVPEGIKRGYWLDFYCDYKSDNQKGFNALVITGDGYETVPVNSDRYIR